MFAKLRWVVVALALSGAVAVIGCQGQGTGSAVKDSGKVYDIKGKVVAVDSEKKTVTLDHEDIPGLMKAMKMEFSAEDEKVLARVKAGDAVQGKLKAEGGSYVVTSLEKR